MMNLSEPARVHHWMSDVPVAFYQRRLDSAWTTTFLNDLIETVVGYPANTLLEAQPLIWRAFIHHADQAVVDEVIAAALASGEPFTMEYRVRHGNDDWRWVCDRGQIVAGSPHAIPEVRGIIFDITPNKHAQADLTQSEVTNHALLNAIPDLMIRMHRDSTMYEIITTGNVEVVYPHHHQRRADLREILPPPQVEARLFYIQRALDTGTIQVYEQTFLREGQRYWEEVRIVPCDQSDEVLVVIRDISDRKRVEQERQQTEDQLRRNEQQFRSLVENIPGAVYRQICDKHRTTLYFSEAIQEIYGYPASDFLHNQVRSVASIIHPSDRPVVEGRILEAVARRQPFVLEYRIFHQNGHLRWIYEKGQGVFDQENHLLYLDGVVLDITERKQMDAELHRLNQTLESRIDERTRALLVSERDLRTLFDSVYEGIIIHDLEGEILDVNRTLLELYGLTPQEVLQASFFRDLSSPRQDLSILTDHWQKALAGTPQLFEWQARRPKDNRLFDVEIYLQRITLREREVLLANIRDTSERKRVEAERQQAEHAVRVSRQFLQLVMDNIPQAIFWKDQDSIYLGCNQIFAQAAGLSDPSEIIGKTDYDLPWTTEEATEYRANDRHVMETGQANYHLLESQIRADGSHIWCDTNKVPLLDANGNLMGLLGTYEDITDRIQAEEALRESKQLLQLVMDNIPQYIFWKNRESVYLGCNQNFAQAAGLSKPEDIVGKTDYDLIWTVEEAEEFRQGDRVVMETNTSILGKLEIQRQTNGQTTWLETNKLPLHNRDGEVVGVLGTVEDITERKRAEDFLREQVKLSSLQAEIDSILTRGEPLQDMLQACTDALVRTLEVTFARIWTLDTGSSTLFLQASSGLYTHLDGAHSRITVGQYKIGRIAEHRVPKITNSVQSDPHIGDPEWAKREGMVAFAGYPLIVEEQVLGVFALFNRRPLTPTVLDTLALIAKEIALGIKRKQTEVALAASEGELRQRTQDLESTLTELQRTQMQLVQSEKMSSLGQLVAGVAHEINNPVNFIYGNLNHARNYIEDLLDLVELYRSHYANPNPEIIKTEEAIDFPFIVADLPKLLASMKVGADRIQQIVLSLRTFSRMDEAEKKAVDVHAGIDSTLMILQSRCKAQNNRVAIEVITRYGQIPPIECYAGQLNQVFMNLLSNAIDALEEKIQCLAIAPDSASDSGGTAPDSSLDLLPDSSPYVPQIVIQTELTATDLMIQISDNGMGIPPTVRDRLFNPFFTTKPIGKGTGMGLSISYQIITERHKGTLICDSQEGQGTTFTITIPHHLPDDSPEAGATTANTLE